MASDPKKVLTVVRILEAVKTNVNGTNIGQVAEIIAEKLDSTDIAALQKIVAPRERPRSPFSLMGKIRREQEESVSTVKAIIGE
jgi:hypothetical protein